MATKAQLEKQLEELTVLVSKQSELIDRMLQASATVTTVTAKTDVNRKITNALGKAKSNKQYFTHNGIEYGVLIDRDWSWIYTSVRPADNIVAAMKDALGYRWSNRRQGGSVQSVITAKQLQDIVKSAK